MKNQNETNETQNKLISYTALKVTQCDLDEQKFLRENEQLKLNRNIKECVRK
jgi:hypothetical protein